MISKLLKAAKNSPYLCFKDGVFLFSDTSNHRVVFDIKVKDSNLTFFEIMESEKDGFKDPTVTAYNVYAEGVHLGILTDKELFLPMLNDQQRLDAQKVLSNDKSKSYDSELPF